jgi:hypothetical protein
MRWLPNGPGDRLGKELEKAKRPGQAVAVVTAFMQQQQQQQQQQQEQQH